MNVVGARKRTPLQHTLIAPQMQLTVFDATRIEAAVPAAGAAVSRYPDKQVAHLDSRQGAGQGRVSHARAWCDPVNAR
ncbi:protein of unknown function [Burkholderia multivorans]